MNVERTAIGGLFVVRSPWIEDRRGAFRETYRQSLIAEACGRPYDFAQGNVSRSAAGVLRGFHLEPWDKFLQVAAGRALVVILDPRPGSPTFGKHLRFELSGEGDQRLLISEGLANAFWALEPCVYLNDVSREFTRDGRRGVAWDDPDLRIDWPGKDPILSDADRFWPRLASITGLAVSGGLARQENAGSSPAENAR
ncbi:dTDP-4-dehydrorhamnose 3,5-epimerase family protein [Pseudoroseicyclus sp. CXY001]|uniref:dTDP-4-dehydrorhamnose 3,5-epimerase family protein n=1 Tax=Pseudoroseicyclus sp. CXY001 TaxID=3242492 RepID=UPI003570C82A